MQLESGLSAEKVRVYAAISEEVVYLLRYVSDLSLAE